MLAICLAHLAGDRLWPVGGRNFACHRSSKNDVSYYSRRSSRLVLLTQKVDRPGMFPVLTQPVATLKTLQPTPLALNP